MKERYSLAEINSFTPEQFTDVFGGVFEKSPRLAERAAERRPFASFAELHGGFCDSVRAASGAEQLELICQHPDLVGRAALAGMLTPESTNEQASAGLNKLSTDEITLFQKNNSSYREKFGFPFIICVRLNKKEAILSGFEKRLKNTREEEIRTALVEIFKIAELRLRDIVAE